MTLSGWNLASDLSSGLPFFQYLPVALTGEQNSQRHIEGSQECREINRVPHLDLCSPLEISPSDVAVSGVGCRRDLPLGLKIDGL